MAQQPDRLWTRGFVLAFASRSVSTITFSIVMTTMATYMLSHYQASTALAGSAASVYVIGLLMARIIAGRFLEAVGRRTMLVASGIVWIALTLVLQVPFGVIVFLVALFVNGAAYGFFANTITAVSTDAIPRARLSEGIGILSLSATVSTALGPVVGLFALGTGSEVLYFAFGTAFALVGLLCAIPVCPRHADDAARVADQPSEEEQTQYRGIWKYVAKSALPAAVMVFFGSMSYSAIASFLNPYAESIGLGGMSVFYFVTYSLLLCVSRPFVGKLQDRRGANIVMYPTMVLYAAALIVIAYFLSLPGMFIAAVFMAFGYGAQFSCLQSIAVRDSMGSRIGVATSTFFSFSDLGLGIGPMVMGLVVGALGYSSMYAVCVAIVAVSALFFVVTSARIKRR